MIDGRILAAVLASLAATAAALGGGSIDTDQIKDSTLSAPGSSSFSDVMPDSKLLNRFFESPDPENEMEAILVAENLGEEQLEVSNAVVKSPGLKSIDLVANKVESNSAINLYGFNGKVNPGNVTTLSGSGNGLTTNDVNISGGVQVQEELETGKIALKGVEKSDIDLDNTVVEVNTESDNYSANTPRRVKIRSFSGDIALYTNNSTMILDGKVYSMESGEFSFGG